MADDGKAHEFLHEEEIKPLIQNRNYDLEEPEKVLGLDSVEHRL